MATAKRAGTSVSGGKLWHIMDRGVLIGTVNSVMGMFLAHPFGAKERAHDSLKDATADVARRSTRGDAALVTSKRKWANPAWPGGFRASGDHRSGYEDLSADDLEARLVKMLRKRGELIAPSGIRVWKAETEPPQFSLYSPHGAVSRRDFRTAVDATRSFLRAVGRIQAGDALAFAVTGTGRPPSMDDKPRYDVPLSAHGRPVSRRNPITVPTFSAPHIPERRVLRYAVTDGDMFATNMGNGFPRTFATAAEAADSIRDLSWRPGYWEGPFRVEPVVVSQYRIAGDWITQRVTPIGRGKAKKKNPRKRGRRA